MLCLAETTGELQENRSHPNCYAILTHRGNEFHRVICVKILGKLKFRYLLVVWPKRGTMPFLVDER